MRNLVGYLKLYRKMKEWPFYGNPQHVALWVHLLIEAQWEPVTVRWEGNTITLKPGQLITGRKRLARQTGCNESFIYRALKCYENEQQIKQQKGSKSSIITIVNWEYYTSGEHVNEQQMNSKRTGSEQVVNTKKEVKEGKNGKNYKPIVEEIVADLNVVGSKNYRPTTTPTYSQIVARLMEGFTVDDFKRVHRVKWKEWGGTDKEQYFRPSTLYRPSNFESYLNQPEPQEAEVPLWKQEH
jgi:uncharacterized phage protein (TIGR02220 family)